MKDRHDLQTDVAVRIGNDAHAHACSLFVTHIHRFLDEGGAADIHRLQFAKIGQKTKSGLQFCEAVTDLLQAFLGFFCPDYSAVADCEQTFWFVDFAVNHSFKRLYFFKSSLTRSCGSASPQSLSAPVLD